ncbi:MAG: RNA methyltransferase [Candidatus Heimdallarchaeota archaeon]
MHNPYEKKTLGDALSIVLVGPSKPQNLGSIARVAMNFGILNLILVDPALDLTDQGHLSEIMAVARRAGTIIDSVRIFDDFQRVRDSFSFLIGTTARTGGDYNLLRVALPPEALLSTDIGSENLAVVFGREQYGLSNKEIGLCDLVISIPTEEIYPVMNLSHAVAIIIYFLHQRFCKLPQTMDDGSKHRAAKYQEKQQLLEYFEQVIQRSKYYPEKQRVAKQAFSNVLSRGYVTGREVSTLCGVLKWIAINLTD